MKTINENTFKSSLVPMSWHYEQMEALQKENKRLHEELKKYDRLHTAIAMGLFCAGILYSLFAIFTR